MRYESYEQLEQPRVARYFPSLTEETNHRNTNVYMFVEDVWLAVMPIRGESRLAPNFSVEIRGNPDHETRAIAILKSLCSRDGDSRSSFERLLSASVGDLAHKLAAAGRAVHEIIRDEENGEAYQLYGFTFHRLFRAFGRYIQMIPKADRKLWNKARVIIPTQDIWDIAMPKELGGCRGYRKILKKLARFQNITPSFFTEELRKQGFPEYYTPERYVRETTFFVAKITAQWGWDQRDNNLQNLTEFYWFYKRLTLKWAQACLREHIVNELNQLFQRLDIEVEIVVKGLPTAQDILKIRQQMCEGKIYFGDALDKCSV